MDLDHITALLYKNILRLAGRLADTSRDWFVIELEVSRFSSSVFDENQGNPLQM